MQQAAVSVRKSRSARVSARRPAEGLPPPRVNSTWIRFSEPSNTGAGKTAADAATMATACFREAYARGSQTAKRMTSVTRPCPVRMASSRTASTTGMFSLRARKPAPSATKGHLRKLQFSRAAAGRGQGRKHDEWAKAHVAQGRILPLHRAPRSQILDDGEKRRAVIAVAATTTTALLLAGFTLHRASYLPV